MSSPIIFVYATVPDKGVAGQIADTLIEERLAACINMWPAESVYRWQDKVCHEQEMVLVIKTTQILQEKVRERIAFLHPFECPAIVIFPAASGHPPFLKWIEQETTTS